MTLLRTEYKFSMKSWTASIYMAYLLLPTLPWYQKKNWKNNRAGYWFSYACWLSSLTSFIYQLKNFNWSNNMWRKPSFAWGERLKLMIIKLTTQIRLRSTNQRKFKMTLKWKEAHLLLTFLISLKSMFTD